MSNRSINDFGVVDEKGDFFEFRWSDDPIEETHLEWIILTERGPRRTELAILPTHVWAVVSERTIRELATGMGEAERKKKSPTLKIGVNRLSPLIGRELAVLLWALMEVGNDGNIEAILHGWRELAREERWWLYAKCAAPGQRAGAGWRLALFHALSETTYSRSTDPVQQEKKSPGSGSRSSKKAVTKKLPEFKKNSSESKKLLTSVLPTNDKKNQTSAPEAELMKSEKKNPQEKKGKKTGRKATTVN